MLIKDEDCHSLHHSSQWSGQPAFHIKNFLDIMETHKKKSASEERPDSGSASLPPQEKVSGFCSEHVKEELKLYCETCGELTCFHCTLKTGKHHGHDCELVEEAFEKYKKEIGPSLEPLKKQLTTVNNALVEFDRRSGEISDQQPAIEAKIHDTIRRLHEVLDMRKTELISQLHHMTQSKLKDLAAQRDQVETIQAQLNSCLDFVDDSFRTDSQGEVLMMKTTIVKQVHDLATPLKPCLLKPNIEADIKFSCPADITASCQSFGQVISSGSPDLFRCHATGKGLEVGNVRKTSTAVLQAFNYKGEPCKEPIRSLECKLVSEITGAQATGGSERKGENQYEISYQPTIKGRHQLHISIEGQHIRGSPFPVAVTSPVENITTPIHTISGVHRPWGVAINHKGELVVTERGEDKCVSVYSPNGRKIQAFHTHGSPLGVALDGEGNILVGENTHHFIKRFSPQGQLLATVGTRGNGQLQFQNPYDISFNSTNNKVYVVDNSNHRIQVLNSDLTFSAIIGKEGSDKGQFHHPSAIACDSAGNVYVADSANHCVQVFTAKGKLLGKFGKEDKGRGELNWPIGIALHQNTNMVYVSERHNNRVSVFTSGGQFVTSFGVPGKSFTPRGLVVDNTGVVYVCDFVNKLF